MIMTVGQTHQMCSYCPWTSLKYNLYSVIDCNCYFGIWQM